MYDCDRMGTMHIKLLSALPPPTILVFNEICNASSHEVYQLTQY